MSMTVKEFFGKHNACKDGVTWAESTGIKGMDELWNVGEMPSEYRLWIATRDGVMSDKDLRLFACWCVRQVWHLLKDDRSKRAVEVVELYANGKATSEELDAARAAAWAAAWAAASARARDAASDAAWAAASDAQAEYLKSKAVNFDAKGDDE